jgi:hypothetical protein
MPAGNVHFENAVFSDLDEMVHHPVAIIISQVRGMPTPPAYLKSEVDHGQTIWTN